MTTELYEAIHAYAIEHYNEGGWDVIVECVDGPTEMDELTDHATTLPEALESLKPIVGIWADRQADARNSAF